MTLPLIRLLPASDADADLWRLTREVAGILRGIPWVLIGGQMVALIEAEHGASVGRATGDVDTLLDVRALSTAIQSAAQRLRAAGFVPERHEEGLTYRFVRGNDVVDVLAPDHLGGRANLTTVPPDATLETIGGTQAISRRRSVLVDTGDGPFQLSIPSLAGAIIIKARAATAAQMTREKHERDLARLIALVAEPAALRDELTGKERAYLRAHPDLLSLQHPAWRGIPAAEDAVLALEILAE